MSKHFVRLGFRVIACCTVKLYMSKHVVLWIIVNIRLFHINRMYFDLRTSRLTVFLMESSIRAAPNKNYRSTWTGACQDTCVGWYVYNDMHELQNATFVSSRFVSCVLSAGTAFV